MKYKLRYTYRQPQVVRFLREVELSEQDLQFLLNQLDMKDNTFNATAKDLMDYADGRGQFATYIDLAARHEEVGELISKIAHLAYFSQTPGHLINQGVAEEADEECFRYHSGKTVIS